MVKTNYQTGHDAEKLAAAHLRSLGYKIVELNWSTPRCEIDIVARKANILYFVEVKYRKNTQQGSGFDYITPKKLQQMEYAAQSWVQANKYEGDYELSALEVLGESDITITFLQNIV